MLRDASHELRIDGQLKSDAWTMRQIVSREYVLPGSATETQSEGTWRCCAWFGTMLACGLGESRTSRNPRHVN